MTERLVRIGMLGCGNVGAAVARLVHDHGDDIALRTGCRLEIVRVAVRDTSLDRGVPLGPEVFTTDGSRSSTIPTSTSCASCSVASSPPGP